MVGTDPIQQLTDARARGLSWRQIVGALSILVESASLDPLGRPWIEVAAHLTGYTTNQLRQAQRTYAAIESFIREQDLPEHGLEWPMSNLEVISRIVKANPQKAKRLLISTSPLTLRELSRIYNNIRDDPSSQISAMSAGHNSARAFTNNLHGVLSSGQIWRRLLAYDGVESTLSIKPWPGRYPFAHPDFVTAYHRDGILRLAAFEALRFFGDINLHNATKAAVKAAVEASFFDRYFWCISEWTPINNLVAMKDELGLSNVGILSTKNGTLEILLAPTGAPIPDRQPMLIRDQQLLKRLALNIGMFVE